MSSETKRKAAGEAPVLSAVAKRRQLASKNGTSGKSAIAELAALECDEKPQSSPVHAGIQSPALARSQSDGEQARMPPPSLELGQKVVELICDVDQIQFKSSGGAGGGLILKGGQRIAVLGSFHLKNRGGSTITLAGIPLPRGSWVTADVVRCHSIPVIRNTSEQSAAIEIEAVSSWSELKALDKLSPNFRGLWHDTRPDERSRSFQIVTNSMLKELNLQLLQSPPEWNKKLSELAHATGMSSFPLLVCGPKSSGKSTFTKLLANRLLATQQSKAKHFKGIAILDLDPGQPEYAPPGQISLVLVTSIGISPSFCRPSLSGPGKSLLRCHTLAAVSPASSPKLYLEACLDLFSSYQQRLTDYPLIINTAGWIQGTGLEILSNLITSIRPAEVIYMSATGPEETVQTLREVRSDATLVELPSQGSDRTSKTAAQLRALHTMSYFHHVTDSESRNQRQGFLTWNAAPITATPPWLISYSGPSRGLFGIMCYDNLVAPEMLVDAINGSVLALVEIENPAAFRIGNEMHPDGEGDAAMGRTEPDPSLGLENGASSALEEAIVTTTPHGLPYIRLPGDGYLDPAYSRTLGLVLVRGVDLEAHILQLVTPVEPEILERLNAKQATVVLVSGKFDQPTWAYTEQFYHGALEGQVEEVEGDDAAMADIEENETATNESSNVGAAAPWVQSIHGSQTRGPGSYIWRVRRDLGRRGNAAP